MTINIAIKDRLSAVKNVVSLALLITIASTWSLWSADRYYPVFPGNAAFASVSLWVSYIIPLALIICLCLIILFRNPRFLIGLSALLCITLLVLDTGRSSYWFYFYLVFLVVLAGYNWRVDSEQHYISFYNTVKIMLAGIFVLAAAQHVRADFVQTQWPLFIKPFERVATPEQCAYLLKIAYVIPFIELFISVGLFFSASRTAALCFAILFHLFSFTVLLMQGTATGAAVLTWHISMMVLLPVVFAGNVAQQKSRVHSFTFYPVLSMLLVGLIVPLYFILRDRPLQNKIDLMQHNTKEQFVYLSEENKKKLPLYVQSFADMNEKEYYRLSVTRWAMHETNTRQVLGPVQIRQFTNSLHAVFGSEALVAIPTDAERLRALASK